MKSYIYLASPYSGTFDQRLERYEAVCRAVGEMMKANLYIYSPITHFHSVAEFCELPTGFVWWQTANLVMLRAASELRVLCLEGWRKSTGVTAELQAGSILDLPISYIYPDSVLHPRTAPPNAQKEL